MLLSARSAARVHDDMDAVDMALAFAMMRASMIVTARKPRVIMIMMKRDAKHRRRRQQ